MTRSMDGLPELLEPIVPGRQLGPLLSSRWRRVRGSGRLLDLKERIDTAVYLRYPPGGCGLMAETRIVPDVRM